MASTPNLITKLYEDTIMDISQSEKAWQSFLDCAGMNYKYPFRDQVLIYAQRPNASACANIDMWNTIFNRWVIKGTEGIALIRENSGRVYLDYVFDVKDTAGKYAKPINLWNYNRNYDDKVIKYLIDNYELNIKENDDIIDTINKFTSRLVEDNLYEYIDDIIKYKEGTILEEENNLEVIDLFQELITNSINYLILKRCGIKVDDFDSLIEFHNIGYFDGFEILNTIGIACSEISQLGIKEINEISKKIELEEKNNIYTFVNEEKIVYDDVEKNEGSVSNEFNLYQTGILLDTKLELRGEELGSEGEIRINEIGILEREQEDIIHNIVDERQIDGTLDRSPTISNSTSELISQTNGNRGTSERTIKDYQSNEMGRINEQLESKSRGNCVERNNLQLNVYVKSDAHSFSIVEEEKITKILNEKDKLENSNSNILLYFKNEDDKDKRITYLKSIFDDAYVGVLLENEMYGYKAFDNGFLVWKGNYLTRDAETFLSWEKLVEHYESMILLNQLNVRAEPLPTQNEQLSLLSLFDENDTIEEKQQVLTKIKNTKKRKKQQVEQQSLFYEENGKKLAERLLKILNSLDTKYKDDLYLSKVELKEMLPSNSKNDNRTLSICIMSKKYDGYDENSFTYFNSDKTDEETIKKGLRNNEYIQELLKDKDFAIRFTPTSIAFFYHNFEYKELNLDYKKQEEIDKKSDVLLTKKEKKKRTRINNFDIHPEISIEDRNQFVITNDNLGVGTLKEKFYRNIDAINVLKKCESEDRFATKEEQEILSQYVGWGGLAEAFNENNNLWNKEYKILKKLLKEDEYNKARASTLSSFYTPPIVIRAIYKVLENIGFKKGNILEPSCGIGNFIGMKPETLDNCKVYGVELDSISGRISRQLYQKTSIAIDSYEKVELPDNFFDVAVGNVPFENLRAVDSRYEKENFLLHDYFFAKTLDKVRPGGIIAFITSKGTLDKSNDKFRKYISQRADLIGAIRLPNNTFKANAGTEVTSDIIFLQKKDSISDIEPSWINLEYNYYGIQMNKYFVDHPEMIIGRMERVKSQYGYDNACIPNDDISLEEQLNKVIGNIKTEVKDYNVVITDEEDLSIEADFEVRNFSFVIKNDLIYYRENSRMYPQDISSQHIDRVKYLIELRDCVRTLIDYQLENYPDDEIKQLQLKLNKIYDEFQKKYGFINSKINESIFSDDSSYYLLCSLENFDEKNNYIGKADMFSKRTIKPNKVVTKVENSTDALILSIANKARVDMDYMMSLINKTEEEIVEDLIGEIFEIPHLEDEHKIYVTNDEYLSGDIREKLKIAREYAVNNPKYKINVEYLEKALPKDILPSEIGVRLGSTWIPIKDYEQFMYELLECDYFAKSEIRIRYSQKTGEWNISHKSYDNANVKVTSTYGTKRVNAYKLIEDTLNLRSTKIYDYIEEPSGKKVAVLNKKETAIAQSKQDLLKEKFLEWIWKEPERRDRLGKLYNEKFNSIKPREYDGSYINFIGMNPEYELNTHQKNAVARILYGGNTLIAHEVGAGKTFTMVASALESKRLGLCNKSLVIVPKNIKKQFANELLQLYPSANVLIATEKDFSTSNRKKFCSKIATGDYDVIIMGHSQFGKIPMSVERQKYILQKELDEIIGGIKELSEIGEKNSFSVKQLERSKKSIQNKLEKLNNTKRKDNVINFEQLGVDRLYVDEAHCFKNLYFHTKMHNVAGIPQTDAQQSSDLFMKCRYLDEITGGKGIIFATGTPLSNSMVEMYTLQRYLQYDELVNRGLYHFDAWASTFGEVVTAMELAPEGQGYRLKTRFAEFHNLPELMAMFREVADIQTADMLKLPVPDAEYHTIVVKPSEVQKELVKQLGERAEAVRERKVKPNVDNMLKITNEGRKIALDQKLKDSMLPTNENSKATNCVDIVYKIWNETSDKRLTQLIFCDLSTPSTENYNVYDEVKRKLIDKGVPEEEIAFIHDAPTDAKKQEIFGKVRKGDIRILMGSTIKMGAGTNCQTKLIALHDLDCPWRPSDLTQRSGRIIRQGNTNKKVDIYRYVTEGTFDAYLYHLVEQKQRFISQIFTSKTPIRSMEDIDEVVLSYAEIKALAAGNPKIIEKTELDAQVTKLKLLKQNYLNQKYELEDKIIKYYPNEIKRLEKYIDDLLKDNEHLKLNTPYDDFEKMEINNIIYNNKEQAGTKLLEVIQSITRLNNETPIGLYRGFKMSVHYNGLMEEHCLTLTNIHSYKLSLGSDIFGNITRINNTLDGIEDMITRETDKLIETKRQFEIAKREKEIPFSKEDELKEKTRRLNKLNKELSVNNKEENEMLDDNDSPPVLKENKDYER